MHPIRSHTTHGLLTLKDAGRRNQDARRHNRVCKDQDIHQKLKGKKAGKYTTDTFAET